MVILSTAHTALRALFPKYLWGGKGLRVVSSIKRKMGREWRLGLLRVVSVQGERTSPKKMK